MKRLALVVAACSCLFAQTSALPVRDLARKIAAAAGGAELALSMSNASTLSASDFADARRALESELRARGVRLAAPEAPVQVRVWVGESWRDWVLAAEVARGEERAMAVCFSRRETAAASQLRGFALERKLLREQPEPMLDLLESGDTVWVLEPARLAVYRGGQPSESISWNGAAPARDPRGRLADSGDALLIVLPGFACRLPRDATACTRTADVDERAAAAEVPEAAAEWGSDVASLPNPCGGAVVLATRNTGPDEPDGVQAFEMRGRRPVPLGEALPWPGPVTALSAHGDFAVAVVRNLQTQTYAAYRLQPVCSR